MAKFIRFEAGWKVMWDKVRDASYEVRVFLSQSSPSIGEMMAFLRALRNIGDVLGSALFFFFKRKDFFYSHYFFK